jgi:hypothetical protein
MAVSLVSTGVTFPDSSTQTTAATGFGFKNRIINGAMVIDQRNAGASVTISTSPIYTIDRWFCGRSGTGNNFTAQRSTTAPTGFTNSLLITAGTGVTPASGDFMFLSQAIEGFNFADLAWGTASASAVTLSFWVYSSLTGNFGVGLRNGAANRSYIASYTINAANTWEQKTVTIAGDTSGTWAKDNTQACGVFFDLGNGSTFSSTAGSWSSSNLLGGLTGGVKLTATTGATLYITGVQLEKGSTATSFDYRPYGTELQLCQRYCPVYPTTTAVTPNEELPIAGSGINSTTVYGLFEFPVPTRVPVTGVTVSSASHFTTSRPSTGNIVATAIAFRSGGSQSASINLTIASGGVADIPYFVFANNASARIVFNGAEL